MFRFAYLLLLAIGLLCCLTSPAQARPHLPQKAAKAAWTVSTAPVRFFRRTNCSSGHGRTTGSFCTSCN